MRKVFEDKFKTIPTMKEHFYNIISTDGAFEEFFEIGTLGDIPEFNGKLAYLPIAPGYYNKIEPKEFAGATMFERKLLDDKKYKVMDNRVGKLSESAIRTQEKYAARAFNYAFSGAFDFQTSEEGVALCSTAHTTKSGTSTATGFSNAGTTALTKLSINATRILMRRFRNDISDRIEMNPDQLVVPDALYDAACEAVGYDKRTGANSDLDPDTGQFKINTARGFAVESWMRLDDFDTNNWFMVDTRKMKEHLLWLNRIKPEFNSKVDFDTFSIKNSVYFRIAYGFTAWQWIYGQNVS
jgi:hypothetical protein